MKRKSVFRIVLATLLVLFLGQSPFKLNIKAQEVYLELGTELLGSLEAAEVQLKIQQVQMTVNTLLVLLVVAFFQYLVLKKLNQRKLWWLAYPMALLVSAAFTVGISHIDRLINPLFDIYFKLAADPWAPEDQFLRLQGYNLTRLLHACLFAGLLFKVEEVLFDRYAGLKKRLQNVSASFWLSHFFISFLGVGLVLYFTVESIDQFVNVIPQVTIMAICITITGLFFLDEYYVGRKFKLKRSINQHIKFLFVCLGFLGGSVIIFFGKIDMSLNLFFVARLALCTIAICGAGILTYLLYLGNVGGIRKGYGLQAALEKKTSELDFLKSQINPHFLFNSLNTVYGIALTENSPKTAGSVQMLSEMMRFMLKENTEELIPLDREISYIQNYIDLQTLRLSGSKTVLDVDLETACEGQITPMILIPFIENAFKHGVSTKQPSRIQIKLICDAESIDLWVKNTKHQRALPKSEESGIGLKNVQERLRILYTGKHRLDISNEDDTFEVRLKMSLS